MAVCNGGSRVEGTNVFAAFSNVLCEIDCLNRLHHQHNILPLSNKDAIPLERRDRWSRSQQRVGNNQFCQQRGLPEILNLWRIKRPALDLTMELERDICLAYDRQLLNLASALQTQDRLFNFTCGQSILTTAMEFDVPIGCIFLGKVVLKIFDECQDGYNEIYELTVAGEVATMNIY
ncbi:hypothetical protein B0H17DRAFT_1134665 [Mycena rosella]|uniref:Uncharacterized protein n=1 Tax=Mycena rosella TaxID=1033263 RepID=A0AAD7GGN3_MYCRO|nr:hypothetical protein B0H17DRAFT_1134665 [Mycena rosella]